MTTGFGPIRMQRAINHWEHFDVKLFERTMAYREGKPIHTSYRKRGILFPLAFSISMFLLQITKK